MSKRTNLDINDAACPQIVHNLQHPTSHLTTRSKQTAFVNAPKKNYSPLPAAKYGKLPTQCTQRRHQANEGNSGLETERVRALRALGSMQSKKKLDAEKRRETHFLSNEEKEKWIDHFVERETAGARKQVEDAEAARRQEQEDTEAAENAGLTRREHEITLNEMVVAIGDSLGDLASFDDGEDGEVEDDQEIEQGYLYEDDKPGWVMGTMTKMVERTMERFRQKQMKLDALTQPG